MPAPEDEFPPRTLIVVGDRVLVRPDDGDDRMRSGLYLPPTAVDGQPVQHGRIVATGPGDPITEVTGDEAEPWKAGGREPRVRPLQARVGDHALFFRKAAVEINYEDRRYLVVPHGAILVLIRDDLPI